MKNELNDMKIKYNNITSENDTLNKNLRGLKNNLYNEEEKNKNLEKNNRKLNEEKNKYISIN